MHITTEKVFHYSY